MSSIAISDHGNISGWLEFYIECTKQGIKPILGIETYLTADPDGIPKETRTRDNYHSVLLAYNEEGYKNLLYLSSNAFINNSYYRPRISLDTLSTHSRGIIGTSGCLAGICSRRATYDEINKVYFDEHSAAEKAVDMMKEIFFGNYYMEVMDNPFDQQTAYNKFIIDLAKKTNTKTIISADSHYSTKEDYELHSMLMAMQTKQTIQEYHSNSKFHYGPWYYIRSSGEMLEAAKRVGSEAAFYNTQEVSDMVNVTIKLNDYKLPVYNIKSDSDYKEFINAGS